MAMDDELECAGTPGGILCGMAPSILAGGLQESLQVLLCEPEVAANWEQGNKKGEKVGLGRGWASREGPAAPAVSPTPFWETSKPPGAQRRLPLLFGHADQSPIAGRAPASAQKAQRYVMLYGPRPLKLPVMPSTSRHCRFLPIPTTMGCNSS